MSDMKIIKLSDNEYEWLMSIFDIIYWEIELPEIIKNNTEDVV